MARTWRLVICLLLCLLCSCGGGSEGTGTGSTGIRIKGVVLDEANQPLEGVLVTVLSSGSSDTTDALGEFDIETESEPEGQIDLEVRRDESVATVTISAPGESGTLEIEIKFNPLVNAIDVDELAVNVKIAGACDRFFENLSTIRQSNPVPAGIECLAKIQVRSQGELIAHVPIAIQSRPCGSPNGWQTVALGETMTGKNIGVAQITFPFRDDRAHCVYRVRVPFEIQGVRPVDIEIHTLTFQASRKPG